MKDNNIIKESFIFPARYLPGCFTNTSLYNELENILDSYEDVEDVLKENFNFSGEKITDFNGYKDQSAGLKKGVEPLNFCISKPNGANRVMSVVNPLVLIPLHFYINKHNNAILEEQISSKKNYESLSKFYFKNKEYTRYYNYDEEPFIVNYSTIYQNSYKTNLLIKQKISDGKYYQLSIDISNFYNSIYTHVISWDLVNENNKIIFDNLDFLNRTLNNNETKGIVIGPYTSSLFSEIILSKIDRIMISMYSDKDVNLSRYCDDYYFYCDVKEMLENEIIMVMSENLSKYKLDINMDKINIAEFPFISLNTIQTKNIYLLTKQIEEKKYDNEIIFIEDIMNEINKSIQINYTNCNYLLTILVSYIKDGKLTSANFTEETAEILLDFLLNMSFKQNMIVSKAFDLIINIFRLVDTDIDMDRIINKWIKKRNSRIFHLKEIVDIWLAYLIILFNVRTDIVDQYMLDLIEKNDLCTILVFEYIDVNNLYENYKEIIKNHLKTIENNVRSKYGNDWKKASYYSRYWLLFYTNNIRWKIHEKVGFKDTILNKFGINFLESDKHLRLFDIMFKKNIEFLNFDNIN